MRYIKRVTNRFSIVRSFLLGVLIHIINSILFIRQTQQCKRDADCPKHHECKSGVCKEVFWCGSDNMCDPGECCMMGALSKKAGFCGKVPKAEEFCWINVSNRLINFLNLLIKGKTTTPGKVIL